MKKNSSKFLLILLATIGFLAGCETMKWNDDLGKVNVFLKNNDCAGAKQYARREQSGDQLALMLGAIEVACGNKSSGIEYYKMAAREGNKKAAELLIESGETPPALTNKTLGREKSGASTEEFTNTRYQCIKASSNSSGACIWNTYDACMQSKGWFNVQGGRFTQESGCIQNDAQQQVPDLSERLRRATEAVQQGPWGYRGGGGGAVTGSGLTCFKAREWISGSLKNCAYNCNGSEAVQTVSASSLCPMSMTR